MATLDDGSFNRSAAVDAKLRVQARAISLTEATDASLNGCNFNLNS